MMMRSIRYPVGLLFLAVAIGSVLGIGGYTFLYARGYSYLRDVPTACANCHVMQSYYDAWIKSSHRRVAVCNDCHTPDGLLAKYLTKASNGFWHSFAFTTGRFPDPLRIKSQNLEIAGTACLKCHDAVVEAIDTPHSRGERVACVRCHNSVGHM